MYAVFVYFGSSLESGGFVYDYPGGDAFWTSDIEKARGMKKRCEEDFSDRAEKPTYKVVQLIEVE